MDAEMEQAPDVQSPITDETSTLCGKQPSGTCLLTKPALPHSLAPTHLYPAAARS